VTKLGRRVDELEVDLLEVCPADVRSESLSEGNDSLCNTWDGSLDHDEL